MPTPLPHTVRIRPLEGTVSSVMGIADACSAAGVSETVAGSGCAVEAPTAPESTSMISAGVPAVSRRVRRSGSARIPASAASASWCWSESAAARAITIVTGSLSPAPNSTGAARRAKESPVRWTESSGRAWGRAKPGVRTMYGPWVSTVAIMASVYSGAVTPASTSSAPAARTAARQSSATTPRDTVSIEISDSRSVMGPSLAPNTSAT